MKPNKWIIDFSNFIQFLKSNVNMVFWPLLYFPAAGQNVHWAADAWSRNCKWRQSPVSNASLQTLLVMMSCNSSPRWSMWNFTETLSGTTTFLRSPPPRWLTERPAPPRMPLRVMAALTIVMTPVLTKVETTNIFTFWGGDERFHVIFRLLKTVFT